MVRIEVDAGGAVSIRREGERSLPQSMTVCTAPDKDTAESLVRRYCNQAYNDDVVAIFIADGTLSKGAKGYDTLVAGGYTGYVFVLPTTGNPDDRLAYAQRVFAKGLK